MSSNTKIKNIEKKLINIANDNKPKFITINKQKFYVSKKAINNIKTLVSKEGSSLKLFALINSGLDSLDEHNIEEDFEGDGLVTKEGGILPFLIPIFASLGITAAGAAKAALGAVGATAAIVSAVNSNNNEKERIENDKKYQNEMKAKLYGGEGFKEALQSFSEKAGLSTLAHKTLKATLKPLSDKLNIYIHGNGLYLYKSDIPSKCNKNNNNNNNDYNDYKHLISSLEMVCFYILKTLYIK